MLHSDTIVRHNDYTNENPLSDRRSVSAPTFLVYFDSLLNREPKAACSICLLGNCMYLFCESYYLRKASILWLTKELYNTASLDTSRPGSSQPLPAASHKIPIAWTPRCVRSYQSGRGSAAAYSPVPKNTSPGSR